MPERIRFTESVVRDLPVPPAKQKVTYLDFDPPEVKNRLAVPGLELVVSYTGIKSFVLRKKVKGRVVVVTLGRHPSINVDTARKLARKASNEMADGINPNQKKRAERHNNITLEECFKSYVNDRDLSANTLSNYHTILNNSLDGWKNKPLKNITRDMVESRHRELSKISPSSANKAMRVLRSLYNYANAKYEDDEGRGLFPDNPVIRITALRKWHKERPRKNRIDDADFGVWFEAVLNPRGGGLAETVSDLLIFILLTGLRRREASNLRWDSVDMKKKSFTVSDTKNKEPLLLPLSDYLYELFERRKKASESDYVFSGVSHEKPIQEPKKQVERVRAASKIEFTIHDLRRTFISVAESCEIAPYAIKALVNHKIPESRSGDITQDYIVWTLERLRVPMQKITDYILKHGKVNYLRTMQREKVP